MGARAAVVGQLALAPGRVARALRLGDGTSIGGKLVERAVPGALATLAADRRVALVSGTNGKTTTTTMLARAMATAGPVANNASGANLVRGLIVALAEQPDAGTAVLECDEAVVPVAVRDTDPEVVVLLNLSRDQLDRHAETRMVAARWRDAVRGLRGLVVANADDPLVVWAAREAPRVTWVAGGSTWRADAAACPSCGAHVLDAGEAWSCPCGFARPEPDVVVDPDLRVALPGGFNRSNATFALVAAEALGVEPAAARAAIAEVGEVAGRYADLPMEGHQVRLFLAKNPAGWDALLPELEASDRPLVLALNVGIADGLDTSWIWDVPFERLAGRQVVVTGERAHDLAVRLDHAGVPATVVPGRGRKALAAHPTGTEIDLVANYTALRDVRQG
jgi:UDP-N-acetylmuramyl tripeptide synthase